MALTFEIFCFFCVDGRHDSEVHVASALGVTVSSAEFECPGGEEGGVLVGASYEW